MMAPFSTLVRLILGIGHSKVALIPLVAKDKHWIDDKCFNLSKINEPRHLIVRPKCTGAQLAHLDTVPFIIDKLKHLSSIQCLSLATKGISAILECPTPKINLTRVEKGAIIETNIFWLSWCSKDIREIIIRTRVEKVTSTESNIFWL